MKSEWKKLKIGDVCTIKHGYAFKGVHFCDEKTEHIVTSPGNFAISGGFKLDKPKYCRGPIPQDYILSPGDIIVTMTDLSKEGDTLGYAAIVPESDNAIFLHNQRIGLIENISDSIDKGFLYWLMRTYHYQKYIVNHASGSTVKHTSPSSIASYSFQAPPLHIQRKIASILSALDDKIETNNAICRNLEEQAEAIFSQYYQKENEPRLFTSVIQISGGGTPKTSEPSFWNGNIPFFTPKDAESPFAFTTEKTLTEEGLNNCSSILYPEWTTFITARGTVGKISLAGRAMAMNQSCYALISEEIHPLLIYFYALVVVKSLKQKASGAVFDAIVTRDFDREEIKLLKKDEQQLLLMRIEPIYTQIRNLKLENLKLAETRSALIPKLMSGELTV